MSAARTLLVVPPPESLNTARIERMHPRMHCSANEESIHEVFTRLTTLEMTVNLQFSPACYTGRPPHPVRRGGVPGVPDLALLEVTY